MSSIQARLRRVAWLYLSLAVAVPPALYGQTASSGDFNPLSATSAGIHLYTVSIYVADDQGGGEGTTNTGSGAGASPFATGLVYGGSAAFGWTHSSDQARFSANYTPSFFGSASNSRYNTFNHSAAIHENVHWGKWNLTVSAAAVLSDLQQLLFSPTAASSAVSVPSTFDDLAAAMVAGKYTNNQLAAILTGSSLPSSPEQAYIYGQRIFTATLSSNLAWSPSTRTTFHIGVSGTRAQNMKSSDIATGVPSGVPLAPTTMANLSVGWSYSLTPRTQISIDADTTRVFARLQKGYMSSSYFSLARTMSRSWFVQLRGGGGILNYTEQAFPVSRQLQYVAGASLGYKVQSHTFLGSYNRTVGDTYGVGASATGDAAAAWHYRHPGSQWSISSGFDYQQLLNSAFRNSTSWRANGSISRSLSSHLFVSAQYGYYRLPENLIVAGQDLTQSGAVLMLSWSPSVVQ